MLYLHTGELQRLIIIDCDGAWDCKQKELKIYRIVQLPIELAGLTDKVFKMNIDKKEEIFAFQSDN